ADDDASASAPVAAAGAERDARVVAVGRAVPELAEGARRREVARAEVGAVSIERVGDRPLDRNRLGGQRIVERPPHLAYPFARLDPLQRHARPPQLGPGPRPPPQLRAPPMQRALPA